MTYHENTAILKQEDNTVTISLPHIYILLNLGPE